MIDDMRFVSAYIKAMTVKELKSMTKGTGIRFPEGKEEKKEETK